MVLDDLRGGGEERLVGAPAHQRVAVVRGRGGVAHEARRHVAAPGEARVESLKKVKSMHIWRFYRSDKFVFRSCKGELRIGKFVCKWAGFTNDLTPLVYVP